MPWKFLLISLSILQNVIVAFDFDLQLYERGDEDNCRCNFTGMSICFHVKAIYFVQVELSTTYLYGVVNFLPPNLSFQGRDNVNICCVFNKYFFLIPCLAFSAKMMYKKMECVVVSWLDLSFDIKDDTALGFWCRIE